MNASVTSMETGSQTLPPRGWVLYDGVCPICLGSVARWGALFRRHGFEFTPLQTEWVRKRLGLAIGEIPGEMKLLRPDGTLCGGVDALIGMTSAVWWLWPFAQLTRLPGFNHLAWYGYRWIARNRYCLSGVCQIPRR